MPKTRAATKAKNDAVPQEMDSEHPKSSVAPNPPTKAKNDAVPQEMDSEHPKSSVAPNPTTDTHNVDMDNIKTFFDQTLARKPAEAARTKKNQGGQARQYQEMGPIKARKPAEAARTKKNQGGQARQYQEIPVPGSPPRRWKEGLSPSSSCLEAAHLADGKKDFPRLAAALKQLINEVPPRTQPLGKFSGQLVEDPTIFLQRLEILLQGHNLETPEDIDDAILPHLTGEAATWYGRNKASFLSLEEFQRRFRVELTGHKRQKALRDATETQQSPKEPVTAFAQRLRRLCLRLNPDWPEAALVDHIIAKMTDRYCLPIVQANPQSMEELYEACEK
ncbi:hypothetical protein QE152_g10048 [Popillia japonica]|uniref:Retrotransposon gag domain-containing protein n=1 Tax=Popillia japonica TaxID=7064 RepID=A0AAW1LUN1_POPJA